MLTHYDTLESYDSIKMSQHDTAAFVSNSRFQLKGFAKQRTKSPNGNFVVNPGSFASFISDLTLGGWHFAFGHPTSLEMAGPAGRALSKGSSCAVPWLELSVRLHAATLLARDA